MGDLTEHFSKHEFISPDTGECWIDPAFVEMLEQARVQSGIPFVITSGCRTPTYNRAIGGKPNSAHLRGLAADISVQSDQSRYILVRRLLSVGFERIGIGSNFVHVDCDDSLPAPRMWTY